MQRTMRVRPSAASGRLGAWPEGGGWYSFRVWAPRVQRLELEIDGASKGTVEMVRGADGYHTATVGGLAEGARYRYRVDGNGPFPDPASRSQPDGPHAASALVDPGAFRWTDGAWGGLARERLVVYEAHVGTATPAGTFDALAEALPEIAALGVTAIEVLPVAECPGQRNWGYDGVSIWAPASYYGGPEAFRRFVNAAHRHGLGVILDVVYNHLGPDGNYLRCFAPGYFTAEHHTPWGEALNFSSPAVRDFFAANAQHWIDEYHLDGLRFDATHQIHDPGRKHVLAEVAERLERHGSRPVLIAEDDRNDARILTPRSRGGWGFDGVWADDLHHHLQVALNGDDDGYYANYSGSLRAIARTLERGWYYEGQKMPATGKRRGSSPAGLPASAFVHCLQNHDQIGNRAMGDRLHHTIPLSAWRAASTLLLLSPYTPMLYMGQEWAASSPFRFFSDHHAELGRAVTKGRREEFKDFKGFRGKGARERIPDPQAESTFRASKLDWAERDRAPHTGVLALTRALLRLRAGLPDAIAGQRAHGVGTAGRSGLWYRRTGGGRDLLVVVNLTGRLRVDLAAPGRRAPEGRAWALVLSSEQPEFGGEAPRVRLDAKSVRFDGPGAAVLEPRQAERYLLRSRIVQ